MSAQISTTRTLSKNDYLRMYRLLEAGGVNKQTVADAFGIKLHTLNLRLAKDRPDLAEKLKSLPTSKKIDHENTGALERVIELNGRRVRGGLTRLITHDIDALNLQVDRQEAEFAADPNSPIKPIALEHASSIKALAQTMGMIPGTGMVSGTIGPTLNASVTLNHATVMRSNGDGILAGAVPPEAIVDISVTPGEDK
jgi:hypothetical protein